MATTSATAAVGRKDIKEFTFSWIGMDKAGKTMRGEMRAGGEAVRFFGGFGRLPTGFCIAAP